MCAEDDGRGNIKNIVEQYFYSAKTDERGAERMGDAVKRNV